MDGERFIVEVADEGVGIGAPRGSSGIGHGLAMVGAVVQRLEIAPGPARRGTGVTMAFGPVPALTAPPGLEMLCALALETVADVSCVDLVHEGVLRRIAAEVADDPTLTTWSGHAVPTEEVIHVLADAARGDLTHPAEHAVLRGRLAMACR